MSFSPAHELLLAYSEWLDSEGLVKPDTAVTIWKSSDVDKRSHDALVEEFLAQYGGPDVAAVVPFGEPLFGVGVSGSIQVPTGPPF